MGSKPMPRSLLYGVALLVVLCAVVTTLQITTHAEKLPACPRCGANDWDVVKFPNLTRLSCRRCQYYCNAPPRDDFSWLEAAEFWLSE